MSMIETRIAESLVDEALARGYLVSVNDGEETTLRLSQDRKEILGAMYTTEQDYLWITKPGSKSIGYIWLVWGNEEDLITDNTAHDDIEELIKGAERRRLAA